MSSLSYLYTFTIWVQTTVRYYLFSLIPDLFQTLSVSFSHRPVPSSHPLIFGHLVLPSVVPDFWLMSVTVVSVRPMWFLFTFLGRTVRGLWSLVFSVKEETHLFRTILFLRRSWMSLKLRSYWTNPRSLFRKNIVNREKRRKSSEGPKRNGTENSVTEVQGHTQ